LAIFAELTRVNRRDAVRTLLLALVEARAVAEARVATLIGTGLPGYSDQQVSNPYGVVIGPDAALYFCDLDNQRIRRLDLSTRRTATIAGDGERGYAGDGAAATHASLNMPHEICFDPAGHLYFAERDSHVVRKVDARTRVISTFAGTGTAGFSGDKGPAAHAQLRSPHSIALHPDGRRLLICDVGNHRIREADLTTGRIVTFAGTGERGPTPDGASIAHVPLNGPRTLVFDSSGDLYLALREGNAIYRIDSRAATIHHVAGTGEQGYSGDGGSARAAKLAGPKGLAWWRDRLYLADTESHVIREIDLKRGTIRTLLGTGARGDGPDGDPSRCALARPHGLHVDRRGILYVGDSEAHRIRTVALEHALGSRGQLLARATKTTPPSS
jgi:sugar lactone lactonase YvrE